MDYGVHLPQLGRQAGREELMQFARRVDELGYHSGWVSDHVCWPSSFDSKYPYTSDGSFPAPNDMAWLDPISTLQFVAACTENLRLGTTVLILPYRMPVVTAKQFATLDVLSGGRVILGVGVGWMAEEAAVLNMPWDARGKRSDEQLAIFKTLFEDDSPVFEGDFYRFDEVKFEPKPLQKPLPIWVGGATPAAFRRVARFGHGFHAAFEPLDVVADEWQQVRKACEDVGRDPAEITLSLRMYLDPDSVMEPEKSVAGSPEQMRERLEAVSAAGISHVLFDPVAKGGTKGRLEAMERFAADVGLD